MSTTLKKVPLDNTYYDTSVNVELDNVTYKLRCCWNDRLGRYFLDVMDEFSTLIIGGIVLNLGCDLLETYRQREGCPPGFLYMWDSTDTDTEADVDTFGQTVFLMYLGTVA